MKRYDEWLMEKHGIDCSIPENVSFPQLAMRIRAIIGNIPIYLEEAMAEIKADAKAERADDP